MLILKRKLDMYYLDGQEELLQLNNAPFALNSLLHYSSIPIVSEVR